MKRVVPSTGLTMPDGRVIAPGTIVSMNAWVLSRNREISGEDVDTFRPERWLRGEFESENAFEARLKRMKDVELTFGAGRLAIKQTNQTKAFRFVYLPILESSFD